jgi:predicted nucleotidyltransferase
VRQRSRTPDDAWQYGERTAIEVRSTLLELTRDFAISAQACSGVVRLALIGSILTAKPRPKDVDVLVTVAPIVDLPKLAKLGRRLKGSAQARLNSGADVFLADERGSYLGRICHYRECHPRVLCRARHCGAVQHLTDDLDALCLDAALIATPPVELWPTIVTRVAVPDDVEHLLLAPLRGSVPLDATSG